MTLSYKVEASLGGRIKMIDFKDLPEAKTCRIIDFEQSQIISGVAGWSLIVSGTKPYVNMEVFLSPFFYVSQPEYWGIEVAACLPGVGLPAEAPYNVSILLNGITGTKGIEVIGATRSEKMDVPPL
jgi:hypothetical protein